MSATIWTTLRPNQRANTNRLNMWNIISSVLVSPLKVDILLTSVTVRSQPPSQSVMICWYCDNSSTSASLVFHFSLKKGWP